MRTMRFDATLFLLAALAFFVTPGSADPRPYAFPRGEVTLTVPDGWDGPVQSDEAALPASATYRLRNNAAGPLRGASVLIIRRANLNPLQRQQWMRGRFPIGLGALRPTAPLTGDLMPFRNGIGIRADGDGRTALVYFTSHGAVHYAVVVEAPTDGLAESQGALIEIVRSVRFTGATAPPVAQ